MVGRIVSTIRRLGLPERLLAVLVLVLIVDFGASSVLFERVNTFELRRDDAERIAENLVLATRTLERAPPGERTFVAQTLSTSRFGLALTPPEQHTRAPFGLVSLRAQVLAIEPELGPRKLELHLEGLPTKDNIGGSIQLAGGEVLRFHTHANAAWKLTLGRIISLVLPTLLLMVLGWMLVRTTLSPLRALITATANLGVGAPVPVAERGPDELRSLTRALNEMQERIHLSLTDRTQTMLAIGHDLKTPLSRMRLRLDDERFDPEIREGLSHDIEEMLLLLGSIQAYVESDGRSIQQERIDLAVMVETLVDTVADHGADAVYVGLSNLEIRARPVSIRRALSNLIENAIHYGGNARVDVQRDGSHAVIVIEDGGPGIPEDRMADAQQPFVRLDSARARDTAGMGLGLAIVRKAVRAENGTLELRNLASGGLQATIRLPMPVD